ncbi:MAG: hypothetical protein FH756_10865 [Firmicutes bacterium]|nr:hypothetical protein [Bacillota bacterium]
MLAILLSMLIILNGFVVDVGRYLVARAELQTVVDASSLAGVATAKAVPESEIKVQKDVSGKITGMEENITGFKVVIYPDQAEKAAIDTARINGSPEFWEGQGGEFTLDEPPEDGKPGWRGFVSGEDSYYTRARVWMKPGFFGPVIKAVSGREYVPIYIDSTSQAVISEITN